MKAEELTGFDLDRAVATLEGRDAILNMMTEPRGFNPSTDWVQAGPIIQRERIGVAPEYGYEPWQAATEHGVICDGETPLIAAMRCYVKSKGKAVELVEFQEVGVVQQATQDESERALTILEEEMERGRSLLGLLDQGGRPIFDDKVMIACLEAIQYCAERIRRKK